MSFRIFCDRCGLEGTIPYYWDRTSVPDHWRTVNGAHLCRKCFDDFEKFLRTTLPSNTKSKKPAAKDRERLAHWTEP